MDKAYWKRFYEGASFSTPSNFAIETARRIPTPAVIYDLGCGDGRDSHYFHRLGHRVVGIDQAVETRVVDSGLRFQAGDVSNLDFCPDSGAIIYARFLLQSLSEPEEAGFLVWVAEARQTRVFIECRADSLAEYAFSARHYRRPLEMKELVSKLEERGIRVLEASTGFYSPYKDENPLILRVEAFTCKPQP